jgi:hypothetical protein
MNTSVSITVRPSLQQEDDEDDHAAFLTLAPTTSIQKPLAVRTAFTESTA